MSAKKTLAEACASAGFLAGHNRDVILKYQARGWHDMIPYFDGQAYAFKFMEHILSGVGISEAHELASGWVAAEKAILAEREPAKAGSGAE